MPKDEPANAPLATPGSPPEEGRAKLPVTIAAIAAALALILGVVVALQVDDWSRDLTQNTAATAPDGPEGLRPLVTPRSSAECLAAIKAAGETLPRWELAAEEGNTLNFVRTTGLFRFKDDVTVRVEDGGAERTIHADSASRVGKADFGQNPRNLRALLRAIETALN